MKVTLDMLPQSAKDNIISMKQANMDIADIADKVGITQTLVKRVLKEGGVSVGAKSVSNDSVLSEQSLDFPKSIPDNNQTQTINMGGEAAPFGGSDMVLGNSEEKDLENMRGAVAVSGIEIFSMINKGLAGFSMSDKEKEVIVSALKPIIRRKIKNTNQEEWIEYLLLFTAIGSVYLIHKDEIAAKFKKGKQEEKRLEPAPIVAQVIEPQRVPTAQDNPQVLPAGHIAQRIN